MPLDRRLSLQHRSQREPRRIRATLYAAPATLSDFNAAIDARGWVLAEVRHTLGDQGLSTGLKLESA